MKKASLLVLKLKEHPRYTDLIRYAIPMAYKSKDNERPEGLTSNSGELVTFLLSFTGSNQPEVFDHLRQLKHRQMRYIDERFEELTGSAIRDESRYETEHKVSTALAITEHFLNQMGSSLQEFSTSGSGGLHEWDGVYGLEGTLATLLIEELSSEKNGSSKVNFSNYGDEYFGSHASLPMMAYPKPDLKERGITMNDILVKWSETEPLQRLSCRELLSTRSQDFPR